MQCEGIGSWSLTGHSAEELSKKFTEMQDDSEVTAGFMWQKTTRESKKYQLRGEILSFIPVDKNVEIMLVTITNTGRMAQTVTPTAAIPLYGRSADNIRDHRHVTSLLHRIETTDTGVLVTPTLSFDERGHQVNHMTYYCVGWSGNGEKPVDFYPTAEDFVGEGGNFERPYAIVKMQRGQGRNKDRRIRGSWWSSFFRDYIRAGRGMQLSDLYRNYRRYSGDQESFQNLYDQRESTGRTGKNKSILAGKSKCCLSYRRFRFQPVYALGKLSANSASYLWLFLPSAS